jgi:nucleoside-diphosphate kinase
METTLVILKPDTLQRRLMGRILGRFEDKGLTVVGMKMAHLTREVAEEHYAPHRQRPFYAGLVTYMTSNPVVIVALRGKGAIEVVRRMLGHTYGFEANAGTIRGDFGISRSLNLVHASDSPEAADRELGLFFQGYEIFDRTPTDLHWIYDRQEELGE